MGRPPLPLDAKKARMLHIRVTATEDALLKVEATRRGQTVSDMLMAPFRRKDV